jgi:hypothetical protein
MPRYFFVFSDGVRTYPDNEGVELDGPEMVLEEAFKSGRGLARDLEAEGIDCSSWSTQVLNEQQSPIMSVPLSRGIPIGTGTMRPAAEKHS